MDEHPIPYQSMIFVCTHVRTGESACSNPERGSECGQNFVEILREEVKRRNLQGKVRIVKSGCFDLCARGPNLLVLDQNGKQIWHANVSQNDLPTLIDQYFPT